MYINQNDFYSVKKNQYECVYVRQKYVYVNKKGIFEIKSRDNIKPHINQIDLFHFKTINMKAVPL